MSRNSCILWPKAANGEDSTMYKELLKKVGNRPIANWIYASYLSSNMANVLNQRGSKVTAQGEHKAQDVLDLIDWNSMQEAILKIPNIELQEGFIDTSSNRTNFTDAKAALDKADAFNDSHNNLVATVIQHGNIYNIIVREKSANTHTAAQDIKTKLKAWDIYKQFFGAHGIDIENMPAEISDSFSPMRVGLVDTLINLQKYNINNINRHEAMILFSLQPASPQVQRLVGSFGSIENAAQAMDDINHSRPHSYSNGQITILARAINYCQQMQNMDLRALKTQIEQSTQQILAASPEESVKKKLHELNKKYNININEIHRTSNKIKKLSEAAADAAIALNRQIEEVKRMQGNNTEGKRLQNIQKVLLKELASKRYYSGLLHFLSEVSDKLTGSNRQSDAIDEAWTNIQRTGTDLEIAFKEAKVLEDIRKIYTQYYDIVAALCNPTITIDESIGQQEIQTLKQEAQRLKDYMDKKKEMIANNSESTMLSIAKGVLGAETANGEAIINIVKMAAEDSSMMDFLYSMGRASQPLVAAVGTIIRNAQDTRDRKMNDIALRIRRATSKLAQAGHKKTDFMFEDSYHIISDIDWQKYDSERDAAIKGFYAQGLRDFDLKEAIEAWEEQNTEERDVDVRNGTVIRTERVPNSNYRKSMPPLTQAQQEYYDTMMQIKGEIGTLLPAYAQHQYLPAQVRRNFLDAVQDGDFASAVWNRIKEPFVIREDDTRYATNGIIDGHEYTEAKGSYENTPLRQIPIFFVNKVEEGEILKDFSAGIQRLAGTAINYDAMQDVQGVVEFMQTFISNQMPASNKAEAIGDAYTGVVKDLWDFSRNNTTETLVRGFIDSAIYGEKRKTNEKHWWTSKKFNKLMDNINAYTSFKALSTNIKGMLNNALMGYFQMLIEAGAGEFYGWKDFLWANSRLFSGDSGVGGEIAEVLTNNKNSKAQLLAEIFDPLNENFSTQSHKRYYDNIIRKIVSVDLSFMGYKAGEYIIHYVNMYAVLHHTKVRLNGKVISLFDAFDKVEKDGNSELVLKQGVTAMNGDAITEEWIDNIRGKIRAANQNCHGAMNEEDKGLIHRYWAGRSVMVLRQWMVEHYSRRFRGRHFDNNLKTNREGYWYTIFSGIKGNAQEHWEKDEYAKAVYTIMRDTLKFLVRSQSQWSNFTEDQQANVRRAHTELMIFFSLLGLSFAMGEPDEHKKEWWYRMWMYQTKRSLIEFSTSIPNFKTPKAITTILQQPLASTSTITSLFYPIWGISDINKEIQRGKHAGENKYWRNIKRYTLPWIKDFEQMAEFDESDNLFKVFDESPSR